MGFLNNVDQEQDLNMVTKIIHETLDNDAKKLSRPVIVGQP